MNLTDEELQELDNAMILRIYDSRKFVAALSKATRQSPTLTKLLEQEELKLACCIGIRRKIGGFSHEG